MGWKINLIALLAAVFIGLYFSGYFDPKDEPLPEVKDKWWGHGKKSKPDDEKIYPFKVMVPDQALADLQRRLESARIQDSIEGVNFQYGFHSSYLRELITYWREKYDWRRQEAFLNTFKQYTTQIDGIRIHFIHAKPVNSKGKRKPLLIVHGWPGSIFEFHKLIPMLTNPSKYGGRDEDALEIVAPSIPGYGFSEAAHKPGFSVIAAGKIFQKLMARLGHSQFYMQGGDFGSIVITLMSQFYPQNVLGLHLNMIAEPLFSPRLMMKKLIGVYFPSLVWTPEEAAKIYPMSKVFTTMLVEGGYFHIQATKPDTVGVGLNDSPAGLAAYILEKFSTATNQSYKDLPDGGLTKHFTLDELLTNVMIYWTSGTITSSVRFYKEYCSDPIVFQMDNHPIKVPTGLALFPNEISQIPESVAALKYHNIVQYTDMPSGGHFAALQEPALLAKDIFSFLEKVENRPENSKN